MKTLSARLLTSLLVLTSFCTANAQSLPDKQEKNLAMPAGLKIDGKATEWGEALQTYNQSTEIYYSVAADDKNICFIIQAKKPITIKKIISQGITISINPSGKKDFAQAIAVTYPLLHNNTGTITMKLNDKSFNGINDSAINAMNSQLISKATEIKIIGSKSVTDSLVSIYNTTGLKAAALFDNKKVYTYEVMIPIKLLGPDKKVINSFAYNIKLNGVTIYGTPVSMSADGKALVFGDPSAKMRTEMVFPPDVMASYFPTDFWGQYKMK